MRFGCRRSCSINRLLESAPSIEDLVEDNPSLMRRFRLQAQADLEDRLLDVGVSPGASALTDEELVSATRELKVSRKEERNVSWKVPLGQVRVAEAVMLWRKYHG